MKLASKTVVDPLATYTIVSALGEGGAGIVFRARSDDGLEVAIKVLKPAATRDKLKRFRNELHFCLQTRDPRIVPVSDFGVVATDEGDATYYVMPLYDGTLRNRMKAGISPADAFTMTVSLLDAVEAAHLRQVWHRDIKPENLLLRGSSTDLVLSDFGAAHFHADLLRTAVETGPHARLANFEYAAPEQRRAGTLVDGRADLYAVGLIIHELFTKEVPHGKGHRLIRQVAPEYGYLDESVEWLTQQEAASRPGSVDELRLRLLAQHKAAGSRRQLDGLANRVVKLTESIDPLVSSPPRLLEVDIKDRTLLLRLSAPVNMAWIQAFQNTDYRNAMMGASPGDFTFAGDRVTLPIRYNDPSPKNVQSIVDDFKRFLLLGAGAYEENQKRMLREREKEEQRAKEREIEREKQRLEVLSNLKI